MSLSLGEGRTVFEKQKRFGRSFGDRSSHLVYANTCSRLRKAGANKIVGQVQVGLQNATGGK
jgi:hypothetical protein